MLDIKLIREEPDTVKVGIGKKGFDPLLVDEIVLVDERRRQLQTQAEELRSRRNQLGQANIDEAKALKPRLEIIEKDLALIEREFNLLMLKLPNLPMSEVLVGAGELANRVIKTFGEIAQMQNPLDHVALADRFNLLDSEKAVKVSGSRFSYLKNQAVFIELALVRFAMEVAVKRGFSAIIPPVLVNEKTVLGTGYLPHGEDEVYKTQDDLYLIGTSELALVGYHQEEIFAQADLPVRYVGFSSCFRREAGTYGKDTKGIIRQHQFDKVELVSIVCPEDSQLELENILAIEEEIMQALHLPYRIIEMGSGDLGIQAAKKYDIETWMPGQNKYRETHSASNTTDFQARRLNIRYKTADGRNMYTHTVNGTAIAIGRTLIALLENGQRPDGSIVMPTALIPYLGFEKIGG